MLANKQYINESISISLCPLSYYKDITCYSENSPIRPLTCSLVLCRLSVVVLRAQWWNHHCPDTTGTPAVHCRGRQWCHHGSQRQAVVAVTVVKVMVGTVAMWGS